MTPPPPLRQRFSPRQGYVYLLRSLKDNKFYLGWTTDLKRRLDKHNEGRVFSTRHRRPFHLVHYEIYDNPELAKARGRSLKIHPHMLSCFKRRARCSSPILLGEMVKEVVG